MASPESNNEGARGVKATRVGLVVKTAMNKTVSVKVDRLIHHSEYKKIMRRSRKYLVHDERGECGVGDVVRIVECRPLSKRKHWRLLEIISKAK